jgi:ABC-type nitrate/sulfonate/bicarbonate transport system substrate-binding protein
MKLAIEWFLNPDHLPIIVAKEKGFLARRGITDFEIVIPTEHYDGLNELAAGRIAFATNEPLHLIEGYDPNFLSLGTFFQTRGGVMMKRESYAKLTSGGQIRVATPVSNDKTNTIGFEIIRRFAARDGVTVDRSQVEFCAKDFYLVKHMQEGCDAGWLCFYNFEGLEAESLGMDVIHLNADTAGFANFCGLDLFTNKTFYQDQRPTVENVVAAVREGIRFIADQPEDSREIYYAFSGEEKSPLKDAILKQTATCFHQDFRSDHRSELPILHFFREIGITQLAEEDFRGAFLA